MLTQHKWATAYTKNDVILNYSIRFVTSRKEARENKNILKPLFIHEKDFKIQIFKVVKQNNQTIFIKTH